MPAKSRSRSKPAKSSFAKAVAKTQREANPRKPFRDIWKDGVTYTFLAEFLQCRESARLSYVEGWSQKGLIEALEFGSAIHKCLEAAASGDPHNYDRVLNLHRKERLPYLQPGVIHDFDRIMDMARIVFPRYYAYWLAKGGMEHQPDATFLSSEEKFEIPYTLPDGRIINIRGRFDAVLNYKGQIWLMEDKTKSVVDDRITDYLPHDLQTMLYCHAIKQVYGQTVSGILYNVIRRPGLRLGKKETVPELLTRIQQDVGERPEHYYLRWMVALAPDDVANWSSRVLTPVLNQVCLWWDEVSQNPFDPWSIPNRIHHFQNPEGLYTKYGRSNYFDMLTKGSDHGLYRRKAGK